MAKGRTSLFTVAYTEGGAGTTRPFYPIKQKWKQVADTQDPKFPDSYSLVSSSLYWFPYQGISPVDNDYIPYTAGDEYGWTDNQLARPVEIVVPAPNFLRKADYPANSRIVYGGHVYEMTEYYFFWTDTSFDQTKNPYRNNRINKWRKISDNATLWVQYWYHPLLKRFYTLENTDPVQELPDPDTQLPPKWDEFIGDAAGLSLENFTFAQIRNLVSQGQTIATARKSIESLDSAVLETRRNEGTVSGTGLARPVDIFASQQKTETQFSSKGSTSNLFGVNRVSVFAPNAGGGESGAPVTTELASMSQFHSTLSGNVSATPLKFDFKFRPNNISYSNIGSMWQEIDRVNNSPILDFKNFKLMKISFEFVVGDKENLFETCDEQLKTLRQMASQPFPVRFNGFDKLFDEQLIYQQSNIGSGQFAIIDIGISSVFRTQPEPGKIQANGSISRATVNITIQELPRDTTNVIKFPKLPFKPGPTKPTKKTTGDADNCKNQFSALAAIGVYRSGGKLGLSSRCKNEKKGSP